MAIEKTKKSPSHCYGTKRLRVATQIAAEKATTHFALYGAHPRGFHRALRNRNPKGLFTACTDRRLSENESPIGVFHHCKYYYTIGKQKKQGVLQKKKGRGKFAASLCGITPY